MRLTGRTLAQVATASVVLGLSWSAPGTAFANDAAPPDVDQRVAQQMADEQQQALRNDYADWEARKADQAAEALARRLALVDAAAEQLQQSEVNQAAAVQLGDTAQIQQAVDSHQQALAQHERALELADRAREKARVEAQNNQQTQRAAISQQMDQRAAITDKGVPAQPEYAFSTFVANVDSQEAIDQCVGGLTYSPELSDILGKAYYPIHNYCNGLPILSLQIGDLVHIEDVGDFRVVSAQDVNKGDTTSDIAGLAGTALLQTCYEHSNKMRVVGIDPV